MGDQTITMDLDTVKRLFRLADCTSLPALLFFVIVALCVCALVMFVDFFMWFCLLPCSHWFPVLFVVFLYGCCCCTLPSLPSPFSCFFFFSNNPVGVALDEFWKTFDPTAYCIYEATYRYSEDNQVFFMTCNLLNGFMQRLEEARKVGWFLWYRFRERVRNKKDLYLFFSFVFPSGGAFFFIIRLFLIFFLFSCCAFSPFQVAFGSLAIVGALGEGEQAGPGRTVRHARMLPLQMVCLKGSWSWSWWWWWFTS